MQFEGCCLSVFSSDKTVNFCRVLFIASSPQGWHPDLFPVSVGSHYFLWTCLSWLWWMNCRSRLLTCPHTFSFEENKSYCWRNFSLLWEVCVYVHFEYQITCVSLSNSWFHPVGDRRNQSSDIITQNSRCNEDTDFPSQVTSCDLSPFLFCFAVTTFLPRKNLKSGWED